MENEMNEEEAKKCFCPLLASAALIANLEGGKGYGKCVGSKCMWWRPTYGALTRRDGNCAIVSEERR